MLLCIEYGILFVDTVNMKIKACNALNAMLCPTVDTGVFTPHSTLYKVLCKSHKHQCIDSLDKHSIQCIVCFDLHIDSVDKQDTIHNI